MEGYTGVKFKIINEKQKRDAKGIKKLLQLDRALGKFLKTRKNEGNLSVKTKDGFLIKRAGAKMTRLSEKDVVLVTGIRGKKVFCSGGTPSSESRMHYEIYKKVPDARIVLHFHCDRCLGRVKCAHAGPFSYGTVSLARSVGKIARRCKRIEIRGHGFVIIGKNKKEINALLGGILNANPN